MFTKLPHIFNKTIAIVPFHVAHSTHIPMLLICVRAFDCVVINPNTCAHVSNNKPSVLLCTRSADQMMVFLPDHSKCTIMPHGMTNVHVHRQRLPATLVELALRGLCADAVYYKRVCDQLLDGCMPADIGARVENGPTTLCGGDGCAVPLFTECYFLLLKK